MHPRAWLACAATLLVGLSGCGSECICEAFPPSYVIDGRPAVDNYGPGRILESSPVVTEPMAPRTPIRVDVFDQRAHPRLDVLWVIDPSPAATQVRADLGASVLQWFVEASNDGARDVRVGLTTTSLLTADRLLPLGDTDPWLDCADLSAPGVCDLQDLTRRMNLALSSLDEATAVPKSLLASWLTLTDGVQSGFVRDAAALQVILVSASDDGSCGPLTRVAPGDDVSACTLPSPQAGCGCDTSLEWGDLDWFLRAVEGTKGFGNEAFVRVDVLAPLAQAPVTTSAGTQAGCVYGTQPVLHAPRLAELARRSGGDAHDLCAGIAGALPNLGQATAGLDHVFPLSAIPLSPQVTPIQVVIVPPGDPTGIRVIDNAVYHDCNAPQPNTVELAPEDVPTDGSRIEVRYLRDLAVRGC